MTHTRGLKPSRRKSGGCTLDTAYSHRRRDELYALNLYEIIFLIFPPLLSRQDKNAFKFGCRQTSQKTRTTDPKHGSLLRPNRTQDTLGQSFTDFDFTKKNAVEKGTNRRQGTITQTNSSDVTLYTLSIDKRLVLHDSHVTAYGAKLNSIPTHPKSNQPHPAHRNTGHDLKVSFNVRASHTTASSRRKPTLRGRKVLFKML